MSKLFPIHRTKLKARMRQEKSEFNCQTVEKYKQGESLLNSQYEQEHSISAQKKAIKVGTEKKNETMNRRIIEHWTNKKQKFRGSIKFDHCTCTQDSKNTIAMLGDSILEALIPSIVSNAYLIKCSRICSSFKNQCAIFVTIDTLWQNTIESPGIL